MKLLRGLKQDQWGLVVLLAGAGITVLWFLISVANTARLLEDEGTNVFALNPFSEFEWLVWSLTGVGMAAIGAWYILGSYQKGLKVWFGAALLLAVGTSGAITIAGFAVGFERVWRVFGL